MAKLPTAPESDCQRLKRAARDGDRAALRPLSDACEEAGDAETAEIARRLFELLARWQGYAGPEDDRGERPLLVNLMISADGSWSFAELRAISTDVSASAQAVSLTRSQSPEPVIATLLVCFGRLFDLVECIGRSLGFGAVQLRNDLEGLARVVALRDGQHLASVDGPRVTSILFIP